MPFAGAANCFRSNLKGMDADVNNFLGLRSKPTAQKWHGGHLPAQPGRQDAGPDNFLGFASQNPKP
jgi:hypothetical protein